MSNPRPLYKNDDVTKGVKRFSMGGTSAGVVMDISKEGILINGYYKSPNANNVVYANVREPVFISWDEFEKVKDSVLNPGRRKELEPDRVDNPDDEYLKTLPKVTINGAMYYIDGDRRERRSVKNPSQVFKF